MGNFLEKLKPAHPVSAELGLDVDIVNYVWREYERVTQTECVAIEALLDFLVHFVFFPTPKELISFQ